MNKSRAEIFANTLAGVLIQFRNAVESTNQSQANICYVSAFSLIAGATISGGLDQATGKELLATLEETREAFQKAFGEAPGAPEIQIE